MMVPLDPKGASSRRWTCKDCGLERSSLRELMRTDCRALPRKSPEERMVEAVTGRADA